MSVLIKKNKREGGRKSTRKITQLSIPNVLKVLTEETYIIIKASGFHLRKPWNSSIALLRSTLTMFFLVIAIIILLKSEIISVGSSVHNMKGDIGSVPELPFSFIPTLERRAGHRKGVDIV